VLPKSDLSTVHSGTRAPIRTALLFSLRVEYITSFPPQPMSRMDTSILCGYIVQGFILTNPWSIYSSIRGSGYKSFSVTTISSR